MKYSVPILEEIKELDIESRTEEGHTQSTFFARYRGREAIVKCSKDVDVKREKEALEILEDADFRTPEILDFEEDGEMDVLVTEKIESGFPSRDEWKELEFCMKMATSAAHVINEMHSSSFNRKAAKKEFCSGNRHRAINAMERKNYKIREELGGRVSDICEQIAQNIESDHKFTHGDFSIENILLSEGKVKTVIDWADCGFTSRLRDIALFEASFIDEYMRFFHPENYKEIRKNFRDELKIDIDQKIELYRFHQNAVILAYIKRGNCSEEWLETGTEEEITEHRTEVVKEDRERAEKILESIN